MAGALLQGVAHDLGDDAGLVVHEDDRGRYVLAAVILVHNEARVIVEVVRHSLEEGADHVYIIDDRSEDGLATRGVAGTRRRAGRGRRRRSCRMPQARSLPSAGGSARMRAPEVLLPVADAHEAALAGRRASARELAL